jgi:Zn-dependent protease with chaperone function
MKLQHSSGVALLCTVAALSGCATNTITGRSQFVVVSENSAISSSASAYSSMIGQLQKKKKIELGTERAAKIRAMTNRLVAEAVRFRPDSASWKWEVQVIEDPKTVNAFCMAGGKMGIYTGFWDKLKATDDEIANVMGHEIGHALASHTREKMSVAMGAGVGAALLGALVASRDPGSAARTTETLEIAAGLAITLPNSREAENEADQIGIELAARAGYDPRAAVTLWQKMAKEGGGPPEFMSTHPSPENRIQRLGALVAKVDPLYQTAKAGGGNAQLPAFVGVSTNERTVGGPSREEFAARVAAEPQAMTFVSEDFEKFRTGSASLACGVECALSYTTQKSRWKEMHVKKAWRDLAVSVVRVGYGNDLGYFMLGEAARGLNLNDVAQTYYKRALEAEKAGKTCSGTFNTCEGYDVRAQAAAALVTK